MATFMKRTMAWLGLVEDYDEDYVDVTDDSDRPRERGGAEAMSRSEPSNVRRISPARVGEAGGTLVRPVESAKIHRTEPTTFNDVQEVGEAFRNGIPVIMNLAGANESVAKRSLDFAAGLTYGLEGRIERVGDRVFLLTPMGVEVSSEERARLSESGFFNQA
jgi:cell division inhibitor SepF